MNDNEKKYDAWFDEKYRHTDEFKNIKGFLSSYAFYLSKYDEYKKECGLVV